MTNKLIVSPSPHLHGKVSTASLMRDVIIALIPAMTVAIWFYGWRAFMLLAVSVAACNITEYLIAKFLMHAEKPLADPSASVTGVLLALNLPPAAPWWIAVVGSIVAIAIAKMPEDKFRKDMFKSKRKIVEEFWSGDTLGVAEIVRFTPSACNTQPWIVENLGDTLKIYRYKKPGKRGIMPADKVRYYNRIDVGIFMYMLEVCLKHEGYSFTSEQYEEDADDSVEKVLIATYKIEK